MVSMLFSLRAFAIKAKYWASGPEESDSAFISCSSSCNEVSAFQYFSKSLLSIVLCLIKSERVDFAQHALNMFSCSEKAHLDIIEIESRSLANLIITHLFDFP